MKQIGIFAVYCAIKESRFMGLVDDFLIDNIDTIKYDFGRFGGRLIVVPDEQDFHGQSGLWSDTELKGLVNEYPHRVAVAVVEVWTENADRFDFLSRNQYLRSGLFPFGILL